MQCELEFARALPAVQGLGWHEPFVGPGWSCCSTSLIDTNRTFSPTAEGLENREGVQTTSGADRSRTKTHIKMPCGCLRANVIKVGGP